MMMARIGTNKNNSTIDIIFHPKKADDHRGGGLRERKYPRLVPGMGNLKKET